MFTAPSLQPGARAVDPQLVAPALKLLTATAALSLLVGFAPASSAASLEQRTIRADADAYVSAAKPRTARGGGPVLRVDGRPRVVTLLHFDLAVPDGRVRSGRLTLTPRSSVRSGVVFRRVVAEQLDERSLSWVRRPRLGAVIARSGRVRAGRPVSVKIPRSLLGGRWLTVAITRSGSQAVAFHSREAGDRGPRLAALVDTTAASIPTANRPASTAAPGGVLPDPANPPSPAAPPFPTPYPTPSPSPTPKYTLDSSFDRPSKSDPEDYEQHVDFDVVCRVTRTALDDPIVFPGQPGASHAHVFTGNLTANAFSNQASLEAGGTNCLLDRDKASYWMPQLYNQNGQPVTPSHMRAYYRAATLGTVSHIPRGLRMIAGNAKATAPQDKTIAGWQCRNVSPDVQTVPKQSTIPTCAADDLLEGSVVFPNCWNGKYLDSADHKSHMAYAANGRCDGAHPVRLPQLTIAYRYPPGTTNSRSYLASGASGLTLHADFWNAWGQRTLDALVDRCINAGVHCGDVSPDHFPGPIPAD
jgi:hypothetical protein